jgi:hypothetical protein
MAKRTRPSATGGSEPVEMGLEPRRRWVQGRRRAPEEPADRSADLLGAPFRVSIGDSHFEICFSATVRDVAGPETKPAKPAAEVLPFPPKRRASPGKSRRKSGGNVAG